MITQNVEKITGKKQMATRPPIVVVLGHVDHGKSSLLEAIREDFRITSKESGGITQHIGAYQVEVPWAPKSAEALREGGQTITFIDTPGHELFSAMRSRGARVADIAILVVAGDDSVQLQTIEAIGQIKKAGIPMVVAINKIDKPEANVQRVKQELAQQGVMVESYGGNVPSVETSATTKQGMKELLEMILLVAEIEDLKADQSKPGEGAIIESYMDAQRGPTATILVEDGAVRVGDFIGTASVGGKVRILEDFQGNHMRLALPSTPAVILGFFEAPRIGEQFRIFEDEESCKANIQEKNPREKVNVVTLDPEARVVNIIVKTDMAGSLEALQDVLRNLSQGEVALRVVEAGVGEVSENDVKFARSADAHIFGFRVKMSNAAVDLAEKESISIQRFDIIYELIQAVRELMEKSVTEEEGRKDLGFLLVLAVFLTDKKRQVIGGKVLEGEVRKGVRAEIVRGGEIIGQGKITNVQHDKKDALQAVKGQECGLSYEGGEKVEVGDQLQFFIEKTPKK